ncbi:MAG: hypothetical protein JJT95_00665 [Pararhodobacter sp.]|nr:hypothetical protein [Pararhodobacter sp.]
MVLGYVMMSMISGALLAGMGLLAGNPLWTVFLLYWLGGSLGIVGLAALVFFLPRSRDASAEGVDATVPDIADA